MSKLKEQLDRLVSLDFIELCRKSSKYQSNLVIIEHPYSRLRLSIDPREIYKFFIRDMYQIPVLNDIRHIFANKKYYSLF